MKNKTEVKPLRERIQDIPTLVDYFLQEWPEHYGENGPGNAQEDIESYVTTA